VSADENLSDIKILGFTLKGMLASVPKEKTAPIEEAAEKIRRILEPLEKEDAAMTSFLIFAEFADGLE
jgi:hypothetical protein